MLATALILAIAHAPLVPEPMALVAAQQQRLSRKEIKRLATSLADRTLIFRGCWEREVAKLCLKLNDDEEVESPFPRLEPGEEQMIIDVLLGGQDTIDFLREELSKNSAVKAWFQGRLEKRLEWVLDMYRNVTLGVRTDKETAKSIVEKLMATLD